MQLAILLIAAYVFIGVMLDLWIHETMPFPARWDRLRELWAHAYVVFFWPLAIISFILS